MAFFDKEKLIVILEDSSIDLSKSSLNKNLSVANYDSKNNLFYISLDQVLFTNPISSIQSVLDAHGFVPNLENVLSCLDSFIFAIHAKVRDNPSTNDSQVKVSDYLPCISFELPQKHKVGGILQSFYDEIAKHESKSSGSQELSKALETDSKITSLNKEIDKLKANNQELNQRINALTEQLLAEKQHFSQASQGQDDQESLPGNTRICRVEHVDLKRRLVKVKSLRKIIDIPTHMLDRVPEFKSRCIITFDDAGKTPLGILFFDNKELNCIERRVADLLVVNGDTFKARDSMRNEFHIQAVNTMEETTIKFLRRGMKVLISIADDYVVRFSVLGASNPDQFNQSVLEQLAVYDIGRNQLIVTTESDTPSESDQVNSFDNSTELDNHTDE